MASGFTGRLENADLPDAGEVVSAELEAAMTQAVLLMEREVKIRTPIGVTEAGRGSIAGEVQRGFGAGRGGSVIRGRIGSPLAHVEVMERGRRPGSAMPPSDALELWVRRRMGITDVKEAKRVAFLVARSISRKGTKAVRMFEDAARDNEGKVAQIFDQAGVTIALRVERESGKSRRRR